MSEEEDETPTGTRRSKEGVDELAQSVVVGVEARQFMVIDCAGCAGVGERLEGSKSKFESGEMSESEMGAVRRVRL